MGPKAKLPASEGRRPHLLPSWAAPSGCRVVLLATSPESAGEILSRRAVRIMARPSENPEFQAGMVDFTCNQTMQGLGPDGEALALELCSNPERTCFQEF